MPNEQNLVRLTTEKARKIGKLGGEKSGESKRRKKQVKEIIEGILSCNAPKEFKNKMEKTFPDVKIKTIEELMNLGLIKKILKGDVSAYNSLYDRKDGKPKQVIENKNSEELEELRKKLKDIL
jgi:hypothetical protein